MLEKCQRHETLDWKPVTKARQGWPQYQEQGTDNRPPKQRVLTWSRSISGVNLWTC
uniref:Uncharacterized protein n=1 Tax=Anguilla anguilla TaxID=7936 RepID=A0A0E9S5Y1_ANGAN